MQTISEIASNHIQWLSFYNLWKGHSSKAKFIHTYKVLNFENKLFSWPAYYRDLFPLLQVSPHITPLQLHAMWLIFRSKWSKKILWLGLSPPVDFTGECNLVNCVKILCCLWNWIALVLRTFLKMLIQICSYYTLSRMDVSFYRINFH